MVKTLMQESLKHGEKLQVIPVQRLKDLENEIAVFQASETLNDFQKWIVNGLYQFEVPQTPWEVRSVILIALPQPAYAKVEFSKQGKQYQFQGLAMSDFEQTEQNLKAFLSSRNYRMLPAPNLPLKRLAVQSGLAVYGRNNIGYIEGMGSFFTLAAYFTDLPCENEEWQAVRMADLCQSCQACSNHCPTGAIREDRFLIDNQRCLSYLNEGPGEFPDWLPLSAHHCLYDCLKCQINCPMNQKQINHVIGPVAFSEAETELILSGDFVEGGSTDFEKKVKLLGLDRWPAGIPRNLKLLFELSDGENDTPF